MDLLKFFQKPVIYLNIFYSFIFLIFEVGDGNTYLLLWLENGSIVFKIFIIYSNEIITTQGYWVLYKHGADTNNIICCMIMFIIGLISDIFYFITLILISGVYEEREGGWQADDE